MKMAIFKFNTKSTIKFGLLWSSTGDIDLYLPVKTNKNIWFDINKTCGFAVETKVSQVFRVLRSRVV